MNIGDELPYMYAAITKHRIMAIEAASDSKFNAVFMHILAMYSILPKDIVRDDNLKNILSTAPTMGVGRRANEEYPDKFNAWLRKTLLKIEEDFQAYRNNLYTSSQTKP